MAKKLNLSQQIIEWVFKGHYKKGTTSFEFHRDEMVEAAEALDIPRPDNLGDVIYAFRSYRLALPDSIQSAAPKGKSWYIEGAGKSKYRFVAQPNADVVPNRLKDEIKVPDATPGLVRMYALDDEQALLAHIRYNRLLDIFMGVTCYSLQSHLRAFVTGRGQIECDEIYVGIDRVGAHYAFPVEAKGPKEKLNIIQIRHNFELCGAKFPSLICVPIGAQLLEDDLVVLFSFRQTRTGAVKLLDERHYLLVPSEELTEEDLEAYRSEATRGPAR